MRRNAVDAMVAYGKVLKRGDGKGPTVKATDVGNDWDLRLPMFEPLPMLIRLHGEAIEGLSLTQPSPRQVSAARKRQADG